MAFTLLLLFIAAFVAFCLSTVCGGGAGLLLLPLLGRVLPVAEVPAALTFGTATSSVSRIAAFRDSVRWDVVRIFVPAALPGAVIGAISLRYVNPAYVELLMGIFLIANLPELFRKQAAASGPGNLRPHRLAIIGFAAGFISGLTGAVGMLFNRVYLRLGLTKEQIVATRAANEVTLHLTKLIMYAAFGLISKNALGFGILVAVAAVLASYFMKRVLPKIRESLFRKAGYAAMILSGLMLFDNARGTLARENNAMIRVIAIENGAEATLGWRGKLWEIEAKFSGGIEVEREIPFATLHDEKQAHLLSLRSSGETILIEEVYSLFSPMSYEAYYLLEGRLMRKIKFR